ncbi:MAG: hypothetical protein OHK0052_10840 [Anaerolineales bacterium]
MSDKELGFESLAFYQFGLRLLKAVYKLAAELPQQERYNFSDQLRRAALSTLLNIAEGYGRYHYLDKLRFFYIARGSLNETLSGFIAAHTIGYVDDSQLNWVRESVIEAEKSLNGYISFLRKQQQGANEYGHQQIHESLPEYRIVLSLDKDQQA